MSLRFQEDKPENVLDQPDLVMTTHYMHIQRQMGEHISSKVIRREKTIGLSDLPYDIYEIIYEFLKLSDINKLSSVSTLLRYYSLSYKSSANFKIRQNREAIKIQRFWMRYAIKDLKYKNMLFLKKHIISFNQGIQICILNNFLELLLIVLNSVINTNIVVYGQCKYHTTFPKETVKHSTGSAPTVINLEHRYDIITDIRVKWNSNKGRVGLKSNGNMICNNIEEYPNLTLPMCCLPYTRVCLYAEEDSYPVEISYNGSILFPESKVHMYENTICCNGLPGLIAIRGLLLFSEKVEALLNGLPHTHRNKLYSGVLPSYLDENNIDMHHYIPL